MVQANSLSCARKQKIIIITGPTAVGKTEVSLRLAEKLQTEIISADSMQIYRRLDIGTGKIKPEQTFGIKHHLIDIKEPYEEYSVGDFLADSTAAINAISLQNKIPVVVGGTGLYINALLNGYNLCAAPKSDELRQELKLRAENDGTKSLHDELKKVDSVSAEKIMPSDLKRIIRALEIFYLTGKRKSETESANAESNYDYLLFVLERERSVLYENINRRVEKMFEDGLEAEVKSLLRYKHCQSMQAIGYKEIVASIDGGGTAIDALPLIQQNSRRYAKRQMTYFRGLKADKIFIDYDKIHEIYQKIEHFIGSISDID